MIVIFEMLHVHYANKHVSFEESEGVLKRTKDFYNFLKYFWGKVLRLYRSDLRNSTRT